MNANNTRRDVIKNTLMAAFGLFVFGFGVYLTIQANLGVGPWDALNIGSSQTFGVLYGTASIVISLIILLIDMGMKEKIGIGMFLDAVVVGKTVDLFNAIDLVKPQTNLISSLICIFAGMFILGFSQYLYMKAGLGCGPRDALLIGLKRRITKVPIGLISIGIMVTVLVIGWLLGGPIGIGTVILVTLEGPIMQFAFKVMKFDPTSVEHQNLMDSVKVLFGKSDR